MSTEMLDALSAAQAYTARGWSVIPVPYRSKDPGFKGWPQLRLRDCDLITRFNGGPQNIGVLLGEPSKWLIDIDLDHPRCRELADTRLPATPAIFGRPGKPRSHRLYRINKPMRTRQFKSKSAGTLVEFRSTGGQTIFPPSTHESGEPITWEIEGAEPAEVDGDELFAAVEALADAVKMELGEKAPRKVKEPKQPPPSAERQQPPEKRIEACLQAMLRLNMQDANDGSARLHAAACRAVEHDLSREESLLAIREYAKQKPFPHDWSDANILTRLKDAEEKAERGSAVGKTTQIALGSRDPTTGRLVLSPKRTMPTADAFLKQFYHEGGIPTLRSYAGSLLAWHRNRYVEIEDESVRKQLQPWLHDALRYQYTRKTDQLELVDFDSNPSTVEQALESVRIRAHLPTTYTPACWLNEDATAPDPSQLLAFPSGTLDLATGTVLSPTPLLFNINGIDFEYIPDPPAPTRWFEFLNQLWGDDSQSIQLLREWFGYALVPDTRQQKMLLLVGPKRSGKGTIARVLKHLVGVGNVAGPTTSSLAGPFGLQPLIAKSLAIVSDARFQGEGVGVVTERLLCISGEDTLTVDRKFLGSMTMKLPTRFMFLTNELPRLNDASGALAGRFLILRLTHSFYGKEDVGLTAALMNELPGILGWSIGGYQSLRDRGHFVQPVTAEDAVRDLEDLSSPVGAFVRQRCVVGPEHRVWMSELYDAWQDWCQDAGRGKASTIQVFGRDLAAAVPSIKPHVGTNNARFYSGIKLKEVAA